jgi:hypothetical protein
LRQVNDAEFRTFVAHGFAPPRATPEFHPTGPDSFWLGLALRWPDAAQRQQVEHLFGCVAGSAGPVPQLEQWADLHAAAPQDGDSRDRLRWLLHWLRR